MFIPQVYAVALIMMVLSMLCWGSWANSFKLCRNWRFELFYWDYVWGLLLVSLILGLTFGRTDPTSADSFFQNLGTAGSTNLAYAFLAGIIFNVANILLVAAIEIAGLAVAFPIGIGLALVIGSTLNYVALVCVAIVFDALAYRKLSSDVKVTTKGIVLSLLSGVGIGLFYPFIAKAIVGESHLGPYTVMFVFALGILASTIPANYAFMRCPVTGAPPVAMAAYFAGPMIVHLWGVLGGLVWGIGTTANFAASYAQMVGPATSYALGQGATMVSALWGIFVWKEFRGAGLEARRFLALMFLFFIVGLTCVALAPVIR